MPTGAPQFGEVWTTTDVMSGRIMQGIIADVSPTRVLFVSLSGNRVAVSLSRLEINWNFVQGSPRRDLPPCERVGCTQSGMIEYSRFDRSIQTCPRHAPMGTTCRITANYQAPPEPRGTIRSGYGCRSTPCLTCADRNPAEDVRDPSLFPQRLWQCTSCNSRWLTIPQLPEDSDNTFRISTLVAGFLSHNLVGALDSVVVLSQFSWESLTLVDYPGPITMEPIPQFEIGGLGVMAYLNPLVLPESYQEHFHAIVRLRSDIHLPPNRPVQRLGGAPNRSWLPRSVRENPPSPPERGITLEVPSYASDVLGAVSSALHQLRDRDRAERDDVLEDPKPNAIIEKGSQWVHRDTASVITVTNVIDIEDGSEAIGFRQDIGGGILVPTMTMLRADFLTNYLPQPEEDPEASQPGPPPFKIAVEEEWECLSDGSCIIVTEVDFRKENVFGEDTTTKKPRKIPLSLFLKKRWRKVVRRSVYDLIRNPNAGSEEEDGSGRV